MKILVNFRLEKELKSFIEEYASKERRSISNFIMNAILTYVKDYHAADPPPPKKKTKSNP